VAFQASFMATLRAHKGRIIRTDARRLRGNQFGHLVQSRGSGRDGGDLGRDVSRVEARSVAQSGGLSSSTLPCSLALERKSNR
jgi:hypothetical protein